MSNSTVCNSEIRVTGANLAEADDIALLSAFSEGVFAWAHKGALNGNTVSSAWGSAYYRLLKTRFDEVRTKDQVLIKTMAGGFSSLGILGNFVKNTGGAACPNC